MAHSNPSLLDLNFKIVSLMVHGDHANVYPVLRLALSQLRILVASLQIGVDAGPEPMVAPGADQPTETIHVVPVQMPAINADQDIFTLFNHVFHISHHGGHGAPTEEARFRLAVSGMYNIALFLHQEGIRSGKCTNIIKARRYYAVALDMLKAVLGNRTEDAVLELALLNNLGHAEALLANGQQASAYLEELASVNLHRVYAMPPQFADFFSNVACLAVTRIFSLSPAA
ncbi:expressed unknown protein [Seminavis robusta]|uniref:Uncharacterized protein n=1 Tax=Seminavis robusta TaxID=568900 RepID=A0A9N8DER8_9STRA|nr:expressed unknown protein [Seminavis robusta]|eukprot:Sro109_g054420.1 n/a (229) ;mRNA; r:13274-13960